MTKMNRNSYDLAIVGGGIVGLWCAYFAARAGLSCVILEKDQIASGPSGGLLGALMPHMPTQWNEKKQFQFDGLVALKNLVQELEAETGVDCGYRQVGRLLPLTKQVHIEDAKARIDAASQQWRTESLSFEMRLLDAPFANHWPANDKMPFGATFDDLSARINPRGLSRALQKAIEGRVTIEENCQVFKVEDGALHLKTGDYISAGHTIITAGLGSFDLTAPFAPALSGRPVKGQAALLDTKLDPNLPIIYLNGVYLIVHEDGRTAIGSTSEREFVSATETDSLLDNIIKDAVAICPDLENAEVVERWANLRMQPIGRDPLLGQVPNTNTVYLATGGFKISFGIAHQMARAVLREICDIEGSEIPDLFNTALRAQAKR
jgi:glycine/D-amino acid oxidase-like deaminating enzyme